MKEFEDKVRKLIGRKEVEKAIKDAKEMGIEVSEKELGFHGIYNENGDLEKLDLEKHFFPIDKKIFVANKLVDKIGEASEMVVAYLKKPDLGKDKKWLVSLLLKHAELKHLRLTKKDYKKLKQSNIKKDLWNEIYVALVLDKITKEDVWVDNNFEINDVLHYPNKMNKYILDKLYPNRDCNYSTTMFAIEVVNIQHDFNFIVSDQLFTVPFNKELETDIDPIFKRY